ncbi:hypothetical protein K458DRAFT_426015 [Lentithecium fluviatile CBS 122367]|uniref:Protein kinase domain-containing protein n=1 Tax=Lentithecium fluviatile CBS 122367 TaxID=1168545 RepID=A0A6G1JP84_9PLEO|nr:hypothetical protein K458DRAFT_426015 [Lentithecium fluviatile CBS 122367]
MDSSDLLDHFKLEADVFPDHTVHTYQICRRETREAEDKKERWYHDEVIGHGSFSKVYLESCGGTGAGAFQDEAQLRAVKKIDKGFMKARIMPVSVLLWCGLTSNGDTVIDDIKVRDRIHCYASSTEPHGSPNSCGGLVSRMARKD